MSQVETVIKHIAEGTTYSWDLTVLLGLGIAVPASLRDKLLQSTTTGKEAEYVRSAYARQQHSSRRR